jgi:hypothetical protein
MPRADCPSCSKRQQAACSKIGRRKKVRIGGLDVTEVKPKEFEEWGDTKCRTCKYFKDIETGCYCLKLNHNLENGFAMRSHSKTCGEG